MKAALLLLALASAAASAASPARTANGLALPAPAGFVDAAFFFPEVAEYARIAAEADRENRTLAYFVQPMPDGFGMEAFAKVSRRLDGRICDRSVLPELAKAFSDPSFDRKLEQGVKETSDRRSKGLSETFGVQESFGARDVRKGATVEVTPEGSVRVNITILMEYGNYAPKVFEDIKNTVIDQVTGMTGLDVAGVNLRIEDVLTPEEIAQRTANRRPVEEPAAELPAAEAEAEE